MVLAETKPKHMHERKTHAGGVLGMVKPASTGLGREQIWRLAGAAVRGCACQKQSRAGIPGSMTGLKQSRADLRVRDQLNEGKAGAGPLLVQCSWRKDTKRKHAWPQLGGEETSNGHAAVGHDVGREAC